MTSVDPKHLARLASYFRRHAMGEHQRELAAFRRGRGEWNEEHVTEWLRLAGIAGELFPQLGREDGCPCGASRAWLYTMRSLPDGRLTRCQLCGARAVVRESPSSPRNGQ